MAWRLRLVACRLRLGPSWRLACCLPLDPCCLSLATIIDAHGHEPARYVQQRFTAPAAQVPLRGTNASHMQRSLYYDPNRPGSLGTRSPGPELGSFGQL